MARKIKETPMLNGKDAVRFDRAIKDNKTKKVDQSEYERAKSIFERVSKSPSSKTA
ncbi:MAG: hypothetical protein GXP19_05955 [Gammaproteobacteria bacterium]|nr:hypothetical protein [Gammaproteobacteria bacterium]